MHIRKIELQGFKSFPDRTTFHFGPGISGVVGPNGCGKSNVVDAVKWCLGEQSARSLRGRAMQDLIFAGAEGRPKSGLAEVTLTFVAGDQPFPGEYARYEELQITRRLFRDGHGEYLINQQPVRLKDIQDLFLDSGASNTLYSFIEQGRIGEIVHAPPEQRRRLIEEAAGITRFRARRAEAERQLAETAQNLAEVTRIATDLAGRLEALRQQVEAAMRYRRLRSRVRQAEIFLALARYAALVGERRALTLALRQSEAEEAARIRAVKRREAELAAARDALKALDTGVGRLWDRLAELEASRRERESARQYQSRERADLADRIEHWTAEVERAAQQCHGAAVRREALARERAELERALARGEQELGELRAKVQAGERRVRDRRRRIDAARNEVMERVKAITRHQAQLDAQLQRRRDLVARQQRLQADRTAARSAVAEVERALAEAAEALTAARAAREAASARVEAAREGLGRCEADRQEKARAAAAAHSALAEAERAESRTRARLESLEALQRDHAGVGDEVRAVLDVPGVLGTLAEHLDVPAPLEATVAAVLGEALDFVLVPDDATAVAAVRVARGRLGVIVLEGASVPASGFGARIAGDEASRRALGRLLGEGEAAEDVAGALAAWRRTGRPVVITGEPAGVAGEVIRVGRPSGGAGTAILARRRELAALREALAEATARVTAAGEVAVAAEAALRQAERARDAAREHLEQVRRAEAEAALCVREAERAEAEARRELERRADQAERLEQEWAAIAEALGDVERRTEGLREAVARERVARARLESELGDAQAALREEVARLEAWRDALTARTTEVARLQERGRGLLQAEKDALEAEQAARRQVEGRTHEIEAARKRIEELDADDVSLGEALQALGEEQAELQSRLDELRTRVAAERERVGQLEAALMEDQKRREAATAERADNDREIRRVKEEITRIRERIEERYQLSLAGLMDRMDRMGHVVIPADPLARNSGLPGVGGPPPDEAHMVDDLRITPALLDDANAVKAWVDRLKELRAALSGLGDVNLVAVQEYREVAERHAELDAQRLDLEESVQAVRRTMTGLDEVCRERFRQTFERVDGCFREIYPRLAGGGRARLVLTDGDLLEAGVEIFVQPPGKKLQRLSLLSGGETAITAIALIFSLFRVKPSPFCLLDEVDAPLDEGNGARFNAMLMEMAEASQFIVVTHNKKTMECATTLYGVTMPQPGVSRLVSVRLE